MLNVALLFGGLSNEHDISCLSAASILRNIDRTRYRILPVGITREGEWFLCEDVDPNDVERDDWLRPGAAPALLTPDRRLHGLLVLRESGMERVRLDCVFPVLHGIGGEDGTVQGLCALAGLPCVGPGAAASACSMDKSLTKLVVDASGVRQAAYVLVRRSEFAADRTGVCARAAEGLGSWPLFVKPCSSGSSVGVSRADDAASLEAALEEALRWDEKALVEEFIEGREIEVAVLGNREPQTTLPGEIAPTQSFYTFDAKYHDDSSALYIPARIPAEAMETVRKAALAVYRALDCRGLSRVDFFYTADGAFVFNEINTIPGFTSISMYPKLWGHMGLGYTDLIDRLIELAIEEASDG